MKSIEELPSTLKLLCLAAIGLLLSLGIEALINNSLALPLAYMLASGFLIALGIEALIKSDQSWCIPSLIIYATTAIWYFVELVYTPDILTQFSSEIIENSYLQIILFLIAFRIFVPRLSERLVAKEAVKTKVLIASLEPNRILVYLAIIWLALFLFGASRLNGDILGALFPIYARAGVSMWQRGAAASAGPYGFIVSSAGYLYLLVCAFFGVLLPLQTRRSAQLMNLVLILISWPYFLLMGARNQFLAVALPFCVSYALLSKQKWWFKIFILGIFLVVVNYVFTIVITYRNVGFTDFFNDTGQHIASNLEQKHLGLNMLQELCFINSFYKEGVLKLSYGSRYIGELLNFVPRSLWPGKPLVGIEYAMLRGFGGGNNDIGVFATISTGFIGQGVINFGPYFGPLAPAFFLALWAAFLARLWSQRYSILRLCLFLVGLGITFNLGRDITLLVLWPIVFGYVLVRIFEHLNEQKK